MEERISHIMEVLDISKEEAIAMLEADKQIDKGEKLFELSDEAKKVVKEACQADRKKTNTPIKRERKIDSDKRTLINSLVEYLEDFDIQIVNPEREIVFTFHGKKYKLVLSCPRS